MKELTVQSARWKRFFNGGILSSSIAGLLLLDLIFDGRRGNNPLFIFYVFMVPGSIFQKIAGASDFTAFLFSWFFWFLAGAVIAFFVKSNKHAIAIWVMLLVACLFGFGYLSFLFSP